MIDDEKTNKAVRYFSLLPGEKQDYVLGILQALAFTCYRCEESVYAEISPAQAEDGLKQIDI